MNRNEKPPRSRGSKRMAELAGMAEVERSKLEAAILSEVGREPSALDRVAAEALSSAMIGSRRKRAKGQSDNESLKLIAQLARAFGLKPAPAGPPAPPNLDDYLARIAAESAVQDDDEEEADE